METTTRFLDQTVLHIERLYDGRPIVEEISGTPRTVAAAMRLIARELDPLPLPPRANWRFWRKWLK